MAPLKESEARAMFRLAVGDAEDDGTGFSVSFNFLHKGNGTDWLMKHLESHTVSGGGISVCL